MAAPQATIGTRDAVERWSVAVRLAGAVAVVAASVAYALHRFMHVGGAPLLIGGALFGLAVGTRLPAAAPAALRRRPTLDEELAALTSGPDQT